MAPGHVPEVDAGTELVHVQPDRGARRDRGGDQRGDASARLTAGSGDDRQRARQHLDHGRLVGERGQRAERLAVAADRDRARASAAELDPLAGAAR